MMDIETDATTCEIIRLYEVVSLDKDVLCDLGGGKYCYSDEHPADYLIRDRGCKGCGDTNGIKGVCGSAWAEMDDWCWDCDKGCEVNMTRDYVWMIVKVLRP